MAGFCFGPFRPIERSSSLYIWDRESESASIVLEGHGNWINGASEIGNERIVSWSDDGTIRLWSSTTGDCLKVLKGHKGRVESVIVLIDGRLIPWCYDSVRLWNGQTGECVGAVPADRLWQTHPVLAALRETIWHSPLVLDSIHVRSLGKTSEYRHMVPTAMLAQWHADCLCEARAISKDGRVVVTLADKQVAIVELERGNARAQRMDIEAQW